MLWGAVIAGLAVLTVFAYLSLVEMRGIHAVLDVRLDQIDTPFGAALDEGRACRSGASGNRTEQRS